jgi:AmpD protein
MNGPAPGPTRHYRDLTLDAAGEWLTGVRRVPSPNCDLRPPGATVDVLVVHGISLPPGSFGGPYIDDLFTNSLDPGRDPYFAEVAHLRVSSHVLVRRDGEMIQYVPFSRRAWHAGESCYRGRSACNDFSLGVELEGADELPYEGIQYQQLARLYRTLARHFPALSPEAVVGHCDIAPGRKTDPGPAFDWALLKRLIR